MNVIHSKHWYSVSAVKKKFDFSPMRWHKDENVLQFILFQYWLFEMHSFAAVEFSIIDKNQVLLYSHYVYTAKSSQHENKYNNNKRESIFIKYCHLAVIFFYEFLLWFLYVRNMKLYIPANDSYFWWENRAIIIFCFSKVTS